MTSSREEGMTAFRWRGKPSVITEVIRISPHPKHVQGRYKGLGNKLRMDHEGDQITGA